MLPASLGPAGQVPVPKVQTANSVSRPPVRIEQTTPPAPAELSTSPGPTPVPISAETNAAPPAPPPLPPVQPIPLAEAPRNVHKCNTCQAPLDSGIRFCGECGAEQVVVKLVCRSCGTPLEDLSKFCGECGAEQ